MPVPQVNKNVRSDPAPRVSIIIKIGTDISYILLYVKHCREVFRLICFFIGQIIIRFKSDNRSLQNLKMLLIGYTLSVYTRSSYEVFCSAENVTRNIIIHLHIIIHTCSIYILGTHRTIRLISKESRCTRHGCVSCWRQSFSMRFGAIGTTAAAAASPLITTAHNNIHLIAIYIRIRHG